MSEPCARVDESIVWQSASGAYAQMVVSVGGLSPATLWNENDENRHLGEMQPRASYPQTPTDVSVTAWESHLGGWLKWLSDYRAERTRVSYEQRVKRVFRKIGKADLRYIGYLDVQNCLSDLEAEDKGWQPSTKNGYVAALRSFWKFVIDKMDLDDYGVKDIGRKLDTIPQDKVERAKIQHPILTREEFQAILSAAESKGDVEWSVEARYKWTGLRDRKTAYSQESRTEPSRRGSTDGSSITRSWRASRSTSMPISSARRRRATRRPWAWTNASSGGKADGPILPQPTPTTVRTRRSAGSG